MHGGWLIRLVDFQRAFGSDWKQEICILQLVTNRVKQLVTNRVKQLVTNRVKQLLKGGGPEVCTIMSMLLPMVASVGR